jgi:uncharacterized iron-regulated membrane protein
MAERTTRARAFWIALHRYAGLAIAAFLIVVGATGSVLAWYGPLDRAVVARVYGARSQAPPDATPLDPFELRDRAEAALPGAWMHGVFLAFESDTVAEFYADAAVDPSTGERAELENDTIALDRYSGAVLGARRWGDLGQGLRNLLPFVYRVHYTLALPDGIGMLLVGVIALIWTLDCFVGLYLTFPARSRSQRLASSGWGPRFVGWWKRWGIAWKLRFRGSAGAASLSLHRVAGLWTWIVLLVFAWSGVGLNLGPEVYDPVMRAVLERRDVEINLPSPTAPQPQPTLPWRDAHRIAKQRMEEQALAHGFRVDEEQWLGFEAERGIYRYLVHSDRDVTDRVGATALYLDATTGRFLGLSLPTGQASGDTATTWLFALHRARVFGPFYRAFVSAMGVVVVLLSITGTLVWYRKRQARITRERVDAMPSVGATHARAKESRAS